MELTIRLGGLDNRDTLHYINPVSVFITTKERLLSHIGYCEISIDENNRHIGALHLNEQVDLNLFLYYRFSYNEARIDIFDGLELRETELRDRPTVKLKERIIN